MHIFIDESGIFSNPENKTNVPSCLAALVIPSTRKKNVFKEFERIKLSWGSKGEEIKGSQLDEIQVAQVVKMLKKYDVILEITTIDMEHHTEQEITQFKKLQAAKITENITSEHRPNVVKQANEIKTAFEAMANPLFIQALIMLFLIPRTLYHGILYYARRIPEELQWFYWVVDAKQQNITEFEKAWSTVVYPIMSTQSLNEPIAFVDGGDYSYFDKFHKDDQQQKEFAKEFGLDPDEIQNINLWKILGEHLKFQDSKTNIGLQIVDILVTSTRRALRGTLSQSGWEDIGSLMIRQMLNERPYTLQSIKLNPLVKPKEEPIVIKSQSYKIFEIYHSKAKSMWLPNES